MARKTKGLQYYEGVGRRKAAVARVRLYITTKEKMATLDGVKIKSGEIYVNKKPINVFFPSAAERSKYLMPLKATANLERFGISIFLDGGGKSGQMDAIILGISRALERSNKEQYRPILKKQGFLKRDARIRERRKVGTGGKARRAKQSPKR